LILLVETNFVLELAFLHEGHEHCEAIVELVKERGWELELAIPAFSMGEAYFSMGEAYYRLIGCEGSRRAIQRGVEDQLNELSRTRAYAERSGELRRDVTAFLEESDREDRRRLESNLRTLLSVASVIPLDATVVADAFGLQRSRGLSPPDALVYSSVLAHLRAAASSASGRQGTPQHCFITRDSDFTDATIEADLEGLGCKILFRFDAGPRRRLDGGEYLERGRPGDPFCG
jgi:predicted nucleic acid-binding protein